MYTAISLFGIITFHIRRSINRPGSSLSDQLYKKIKWVNGRWCVGRSFLPLPSWSVSEGAKEGRVQRSCGCPSISTSQYLIGHNRRQREGRWLKFGWMFPRCQHAVRARWRLCPLEQGAGAFWGWRGRVCGAVTHGQNVIVAGDVAASGKVIGALGEAGGHSIRSLQDTHRRLCHSSGKKDRGKKWERYVRNTEVEEWQVQAEGKNENKEVHAIESSSHLLLSRLTMSVQAHSVGHDQKGHTLQNPAELHKPEQQRTHQHHRHSCSHCPGGWQCLQRALHGGRGISSPRSCSLCACKPALAGL